MRFITNYYANVTQHDCSKTPKQAFLKGAKQQRASETFDSLALSLGRHHFFHTRTLPLGRHNYLDVVSSK